VDRHHAIVPPTYLCMCGSLHHLAAAATMPCSKLNCLFLHVPLSADNLLRRTRTVSFLTRHYATFGNSWDIPHTTTPTYLLWAQVRDGSCLPPYARTATYHGYYLLLHTRLP